MEIKGMKEGQRGEKGRENKRRVSEINKKGNKGEATLHWCEGLRCNWRTLGPGDFDHGRWHTLHRSG